MKKVYEIKNGKCYELIFRAWKRAKDGMTRIYPKNAKAFVFPKEADCYHCGTCG